MCVVLQKLNSLLFSDLFLEYVHDCLGGLEIALVGLDRQLFCCKSPHISLVILSIDLASLCDNQSTKIPQLRPGPEPTVRPVRFWPDRFLLGAHPLLVIKYITL